MTSITIAALLANARYTRTAVEHEMYKQVEEENEAHWARLENRYTIFDTLKSESTPKQLTYDLIGYWVHERQQKTTRPDLLLHIDRDGLQTQYRYEHWHECYRNDKENELVYYGNSNMIVKERSEESRYSYLLTVNGNLNIEELYRQGGWGVTSYAKIDSRDASYFSFCDTDN